LTGAFTGDTTCTNYSAVGVGVYSHSYAYNAIGTLTSNNGITYTYGLTQPHAVTAAFGNAYSYDPNGNQAIRRVAPYTHTLSYDTQGHLVSVSAAHDPVTTTVITDTSRLTYKLYLPMVMNNATAIITTSSFTHDAEGTRVKGTVGNITTVYIAGLHEWQAGATTKYYEGGAMRRSGYASGNCHRTVTRRTTKSQQAQ
jgi:YD repeat-containing protein